MTSATKRRHLLHELSAKQAIALECLDARGSHLVASQGAGVDRTTVSRWTTKHPAFVAELNRRKRERSEETALRIRQTTLKALETVSVEIEEGDVGLSMRWLALFGRDCLNPPIDDPTTPRDVVEHRRLELSLGGDALALLDSMDGRTTDRAEQEILIDLQDG